MNVFSESHFLHSKEEKKNVAKCVHEEMCVAVISDLQLSPCVSAAKKLPFNLVLSSSAFHVSGLKPANAGQTVTLFNRLGTSWQLKSPYRLSVSTYGRSQHITLLKRQAPFPVVSTVTWTEQGSLITRPDVTVTIKMNCKNPAGAIRWTITWQRILHKLLGGMERTSSLLRPWISIFSSREDLWRILFLPILF